jgi:hypothetical protein
MLKVSFHVPAACLIAAACSGRAEYVDADSPAVKAPVTTDTTAVPPPASTPVTWAVSPSGIGTVRIGASLDELKTTAGDVTVPAAGGDCQYVRGGSLPSGVSVMLARNVVARVDIDSSGVTTAEGVGVGDPASRVNEVFAGRVTAMPHKYVQGAQYLTVKGASPADSAHRIVFEVENGRVARFRAGRVPEVEWVERCG